MNLIERIHSAAKAYDEQKKPVVDSNTRLTDLIAHHGIEAVSAASGLKVSSLVQYTTKKGATKVSESTVVKAETVLSQF